MIHRQDYLVIFMLVMVTYVTAYSIGNNAQGELQSGSFLQKVLRLVKRDDSNGCPTNYEFSDLHKNCVCRSSTSDSAAPTAEHARHHQSGGATGTPATESARHYQRQNSGAAAATTACGACNAAYPVSGTRSSHPTCSKKEE